MMKVKDNCACCLKTLYFQLSLDENGKVLNFSRCDSGKNLLSNESNNFFGMLLTNKDAEPEYPSLMSYNEKIITTFYPKSGVTAKILVEETPLYLAFTLISADPANFYSLSFICIETNTDSDVENDFAVSCISMNLRTNTTEYPGNNTHLEAIAYPHIGETGAKAALTGAHKNELRAILKKICIDIPQGDMPINLNGGPWALDNPKNTGTYTIVSSPVTLENVDQYIAHLKNFSISQINFHKGVMFRQGDMEVNTEYYPEGRKTLKQVIERFHDAGILVGLHSYSFFIDHYSSFVTPVPDPDLDTVARFLLETDLNEVNNNICVKESTAGVSLDTGFFIINSVILKIDNELITFSGVSKEQPYCFTGCKRGAYGTKQATHKKGTEVAQLKSYFGQLTPKANSLLFFKVARETADFYNECSFDMFYLDAIDGTFILDSNEYSWYHAPLFINELFKNIKRPPIFGCCYGPQYPNTWFARSRVGALDHCTRGYKTFIDVHVEYNNNNAESMFLPSELGWWTLSHDAHKEEIGRQYRVLYDDDIEYLCLKGLAADSSHCFINLSLDVVKSFPILKRYANIIRLYEKLRNEKYFSVSIKRQLKESRSDFTLKKTEHGDYYFVPRYSSRFRIDSLDDDRNKFILHNGHSEQSIRLRIEALWDIMPYDCPAGQEILTVDSENSLNENLSLHFEHSLNIKDQPAIGLWVYGDGSSRIICIQLQSPMTVFGGISERFIKADFTGWRYFEFYESHNCELPESDWPRKELEYKVYTDVHSFYHIYTTAADYSNISEMRILLSSPGEGIRISSIKALPARKQEVINPAVTIEGVTVFFKTKLKSGDFLECTPDGECAVYDQAGNLIDRPEIVGKLPVLPHGDSTLILGCKSNSPKTARATITIFTEGERLE